MRRRLDGGLVLLLTPLIWGATFPATKLAVEHLPPFAVMAWSRGLGFLAIAGVVPMFRRRHGSVPVREAILPSVLLGTLMFLGYSLQTEGLARTSATNAGFITGLYVVFTPVISAALFRERVPGAAWGAVALSLAGLALLSIRDLDGARLHTGDLLVMAAAVAWAGHITAVGRLSPRYPAWILSVGQMGVATVLHAAAAIGPGLRPTEAVAADVWPLLILTGILGSGVAFTIQLIGQQRVTATRAVILLAGESLFSALFSALWIGERLAGHQWGGAILVMAAMAYSELSARRSPELLEPAPAD